MQMVTSGMTWLLAITLMIAWVGFVQPVIADEAVTNYIDMTPTEQELANRLFNGHVSQVPNLNQFADIVDLKVLIDPVLYAEWDRYLSETTSHGVGNHVTALEKFRAEYHAALMHNSAQLEKCNQRGTYDPSWVTAIKKQISPEVIKSHRSEIPIILKYLHAIAEDSCMKRAEQDAIVREARYHQAVIGYISDFSEFGKNVAEPLREKMLQRSNEINAYLGVMLKSSVARMLSLKQRRTQLLAIQIRQFSQPLVKTLSQYKIFEKPFDLPKAVADAARI